MTEELHIIRELDTNTEIGWWNENRKIVNKAIRKYNKWQIKHNFSKEKASKVLLRIEVARQLLGEHSYDYDELQEMEKFVKRHLR